MLNFYQRFLSPFLHSLLFPLTGNTHACRFSPTCSEYSRQAISTYGIIAGSLLSLRRLLRCHPFSAGGYDPIPLKNTNINQNA